MDDGATRSPGRAPTLRKDAWATRTALLEAARRTFAERGYRDASVREICGRAGVNVGAVNRHFGSKQSLYERVLVDAGRMLLARETVPRLEEFASPEAALEAWMLFHLRLVLLRRREDPVAGSLLLREFHEPTPAFEGFLELVVVPVRRELMRILAVLLDAPVGSERVRFAADHVHGTCLFQGIGASVLERFGQPSPVDDAGVRDRLARLFPAVLAGVRAG